MYTLRFFRIFILVIGLFMIFSCNDRKVEERLPRKVEIGDSLFITKIFLDQSVLIKDFKISKDTFQFKSAIDSLFKNYHPAWNDCFNYPKENLYDLHLNYALSDSEEINNRTTRMLNNNADSILTDTYLKVKNFSGYKPSGNHYLIFMFDNTEFSMGGCDKDLMYINLYNNNFSLKWLENLFSHELNHQIYEKTLPEANFDLVLWSVIDEGFASYFQKLVTRCSAYEAISISQEEYNWCLKNEKEIFEKVLPILQSTKKEDVMLLRNKEGLLQSSPGQLNYFIGYRIIEKYVEKYGENSWKDIYTMPVDEVLAKSGYEEYIKKIDKN